MNELVLFPDLYENGTFLARWNVKTKEAVKRLVLWPQRTDVRLRAEMKT